MVSSRRYRRLNSNWKKMIFRRKVRGLFSGALRGYSRLLERLWNLFVRITEITDRREIMQRKE